MNLDKLWETKTRLEQINRNVSQGGADQSCEKRGSFESRHKRITLYLENSTYIALQSIRNQGVSQSLVVNLALKEFIEKNWPVDE